MTARTFAATLIALTACTSIGPYDGIYCREDGEAGGCETWEGGDGVVGCPGDPPPFYCDGTNTRTRPTTWSCDEQILLGRTFEGEPQHQVTCADGSLPICVPTERFGGCGDSPELCEPACDTHMVCIDGACHCNAHASRTGCSYEDNCVCLDPSSCRFTECVPAFPAEYEVTVSISCVTADDARACAESLLALQAPRVHFRGALDDEIPLEYHEERPRCGGLFECRWSLRTTAWLSSQTIGLDVIDEDNTLFASCDGDLTGNVDRRLFCDADFLFQVQAKRLDL